MNNFETSVRSFARNVIGNYILYHITLCSIAFIQFVQRSIKKKLHALKTVKFREVYVVAG